MGKFSRHYINHFFSGYRFCEFNESGNIYAVKRKIVDGQAENTPLKDLYLQYESEIISGTTLEVIESTPLVTGKSIKGLQLNLNKETKSVLIGFNSKQVVVQSVD